jgi:FMN reductase
MSHNEPLIVGIGGTTRANSSTERALRMCLDACERRGARTQVFGAERLQLPHYAPEAQSRSEDALELISALRKADGVIVATPGYHGGLSGLVKNALDYVEDLAADDRPYLDGRVVATVVCAYGWQATTTTLTSLRSTIHALRGWPTPFGLTINSAEPVWGPLGEVADQRIAAQIETLAEQVVSFVNHHARSYA